VFILFTNIGARSCDMYGYPGVAVLNANGGQEYQATRKLSGYIGGVWLPATKPPSFTLAPGAQGPAILEFAISSQPNGVTCPTAPGLLVTMPDDTVSIHIALTLPDCGKAEIHPVVPGPDGRYE
jgi:hypothetical protein